MRDPDIRKVSIEVDGDKRLSFLVGLMARLRSPGGCPWDLQQTHQSLRPYLVEEAYEVIEAIDSGNPGNLKEELGDLLLQIIFHSQLASEKGDFSIDEVIQAISQKIIRRHPHVFNGEKAERAEEVSRKWSEIKRQEKKRASVFSVSAGLPALKRAQKIQQQAARCGFDWEEVEGAWEKLDEELKELEKVYNTGDKDKIEEETGDLIFAVVNVARFLNVDAELALNAAVAKFHRRMDYIEKSLRREGKLFKDYSLLELDKLWEEAKKNGL